MQAGEIVHVTAGQAAQKSAAATPKTTASVTAGQAAQKIWTLQIDGSIGVTAGQAAQKSSKPTL